MPISSVCGVVCARAETARPRKIATKRKERRQESGVRRKEKGSPILTPDS
jgi:hypothetical protein